MGIPSQRFCEELPPVRLRLDTKNYDFKNKLQSSKAEPRLSWSFSATQLHRLCNLCAFLVWSLEIILRNNQSSACQTPGLHTFWDVPHINVREMEHRKDLLG